MKKIIFSLIILLIPVHIYATEINFSPKSVLLNGTTLVPLRILAEAFATMVPIIFISEKSGAIVEYTNNEIEYTIDLPSNWIVDDSVKSCSRFYTNKEKNYFEVMVYQNNNQYTLTETSKKEFELFKTKYNVYKNSEITTGEIIFDNSLSHSMIFKHNKTNPMFLRKKQYISKDVISIL